MCGSSITDFPERKGRNRRGRCVIARRWRGYDTIAPPFGLLPKPFSLRPLRSHADLRQEPKIIFRN
jgi:hypothetical protein